MWSIQTKDKEVLAILMQGKMNMQKVAPEKHPEKIFKEVEEQNNTLPLETFAVSFFFGQFIGVCSYSFGPVESF